MSQHVTLIKECSGCLTVKPLTEFHTDKRLAGGHRAQCKACRRAATIRWNAANKPQHARRRDVRFVEYTPLHAAAPEIITTTCCNDRTVCPLHAAAPELLDILKDLIAAPWTTARALLARIEEA